MENEMTDRQQTAKEVAVIDRAMRDVADFTVVARDPAEMQQSQDSLIAWAKRKVEAERTHLAEAQEQHDIAVKNKWRATAWKNQVSRARREVDYYEKIAAALEAGYYIVPPFPVDVFAVRTNQNFPDGGNTYYRHANHQQKGRILPKGEGRYVNVLPKVWQQSIPFKNDKTGEVEQRIQYWAQEFRDVDFPFKFAKPAVLNATAEAMAMRVFDRIGVLPRHQAPDPIVCGQIFNPNRRYAGPTTFFIAWWLDTRTI